MTAQTRGPLTRGPLPARVYWRRRLVVLAVALLLVLGVARLLGGGSDASDGSDGGETASLAADAPAPTSPAASDAGESPSDDATPRRRTPRGSAPTAPTTSAPVLAEPDGPCVDSDVAVTPEVSEAVAGPRHGVVLALQLRTIAAEACTWKVSPKSLTLKITSGKDDIWSTRECPGVIPRQQVTVRRAASTTLTVEWNGRRSDEDCSKLTAWAMPGWYHVSAAALAGEPSDVQFELLAPQPAVVTKTVDPKPDKDKRKNKSRKNRTTPTEEPASTGEPSGAVEPDLG